MLTPLFKLYLTVNQFHLSTTLLLKVYFLMSTPLFKIYLTVAEWPVLPPSQLKKLISYIIHITCNLKRFK